MSLVNVRAFERLLASGASEAQVDEFLAALENPDKGSHEERLVKHFSKQGVLRDQVEFSHRAAFQRRRSSIAARGRASRSSSSAASSITSALPVCARGCPA